MKPLITLILVAVASASLGHEAKSTASLQWANVSSGYHRFEEIKPKLVNNGDSSIFLSQMKFERVRAIRAIQSGHRKLGDG